MKINFDVPDDFSQFRLSDGVNARLQALLDRQDSGVPLTEQEREEAEGLADLADLFSLFRLRTNP